MTLGAEIFYLQRCRRFDLIEKNMDWKRMTLLVEREKRERKRKEKKEKKKKEIKRRGGPSYYKK